MIKTHSKSGLLTILAILVFSILFVGGLYYYAHRNAASRPEYSSAIPGIPPQKLVLISCNLKWSAPSDQLIKDFKSLTPDFILLQQVSLKNAESIASALDMRHTGQLQLYYSPTNPNTTEAPGNAILSRHAIFQGRVISDKFAGDAGIWVEPVILGKRFYLANVDLTPPPLAAPAAKLRQEAIDALIKSFSEAPTPCIIGGTIAGSIKMPPGLSHDLFIGDPPVARFFLSRGWSAPMLLDGHSNEISYGTLIFNQ
ncbi:MAG TPA: endonuclease/exonuclease/phosphatase family protein [Tepidisphaeraceae bacterium]|nr:endonuclease/exonuclease/phosphatase family protein [Tepidisphaeraceae bacterium]